MSTCACNHDVFFYSSEQEFSKAFIRLLRPAIDRKEPLLLIMTPSHRKLINDYLCSESIDTNAMRSSGLLQEFDAEETLSRFFRNAEINKTAFKEYVGGIMAATKPAFPEKTPWAYGEMVDLLCKAGHGDSALQLEHLWSNLVTHHKFSLLCAYELDPTDLNASPNLFTAAAMAHDHVLPLDNDFELTQRMKQIIEGAVGTKGLQDVWEWACSSRKFMPESTRVLLFLRQFHPELAKIVVNTLKYDKNHSLAS